MPTSKLPQSKRRGYSKNFTPSDRAASKRYLLDKIPASLWIAARARAKREGLSMRALILHLLTAYAAVEPSPTVRAAVATFTASTGDTRS